MKIIKIVFWLRVILLTIVCLFLVNAKLFIEGGLIALFVLYDLTRIRLRDIQIRLDKIEGLKE